jgi:hypothetical protein
MFAFILFLCCPVYVATLRRADHSSKESYQPSISVRLRNLIRGGQARYGLERHIRRRRRTASHSFCRRRYIALIVTASLSNKLKRLFYIIIQK